MELLQYGNMTLDYKNKAYYYEPHTPEAPDAYKKRQPLSRNGRRKNGGWHHLG